MSSSGARTEYASTMAPPRGTRLGQRRVLRSASCAAVPGPTARGASARRAGARSIPAIASAMLSLRPSSGLSGARRGAANPASGAADRSDPSWRSGGRGWQNEFDDFVVDKGRTRTVAQASHSLFKAGGLSKIALMRFRSLLSRKGRYLRETNHDGVSTRKAAKTSLKTHS